MQVECLAPSTRPTVGHLMKYESVGTCYANSINTGIASACLPEQVLLFTDHLSSLHSLRPLHHSMCLFEQSSTTNTPYNVLPPLPLCGEPVPTLTTDSSTHPQRSEKTQENSDNIFCYVVFVVFLYI